MLAVIHKTIQGFRVLSLPQNEVGEDGRGGGGGGRMVEVGVGGGEYGRGGGGGWGFPII